MFMERYEESIAFFRRANELDPGNAEIRRCLREAEGLEHSQRATLASTMGQPVPKQPLRRAEVAPPRFDPESMGKKIGEELLDKSENARGLAAWMQNCDTVWSLPKRLVDFLEDAVLAAAWEKAMGNVLEGSWYEPPDVPAESGEVSSPCPSVLMYGSFMGFLLVTAAEKVLFFFLFFSFLTDFRV